MSVENLDADDYVRWLGKQKPVGLFWIGLAILEVAAAIFIVSESYIRVNKYWDTVEPNITIDQVIKQLQPKIEYRGNVER